MYNHQNPEHKQQQQQQPPPISPRISFSNDFVESSSSSSSSSSYSHSHGRHHAWPPPAAVSSYRDAPVSSDFEFSVSNYSMMSADELFFKGRLLPLKETKTTTTLRDELQNNNDEDEDINISCSSSSSNINDNFSLRPPKNPTRWRGFLGLRKSHIGSKKSGEKRPPAFGQHDDNVQCTSKNSQEYED